jgi:hypothetical protein
MRSSRVRRLLCLTGAALTAALLLSAPATAAEAGPTGSANYVCNLTAGGSAKVSVTMSLDNVPASVTPGQTLRLGGTLTFGFTTQTALATHLLLANKVGVSSAEFALDVVTAGKSQTIRAVAVQGQQTAIGKPFELAAKVVLPDYTVPAKAAGEVVLSLPSKATLPNTVAKTPATVAFTTVLSENGLVGQRTLACAVSGTDTAPLITRIPVEAPTPATSAPSSAPALGAPALSAPISAAGLGPASASAPATSAAPQTRPVFDAIPPSTRHSGVFIPAWSLAVLALLVPVGALTYALSLRRRLHLMQLAAGTEGSRVPIRRRSRS